MLARSVAEPGFRGCAFVNASAEALPGSAVEAASDEARGWRRSFFADLARDTGAPHPERLATQIDLLYDGAIVGARMDRDPTSVAAARTMAATLLAAALAQNGA